LRRSQPLSLWTLSSRQLVLTVVLALCASCGLARAGLAHPHVWVTVRSEIVFSPNHQIIGIRHAWTFDEFYTAMTMQGIDANGDGILSKEELKPVVDAMVGSLKPFDYFTYVHLHGEENRPAAETPRALFARLQRQDTHPSFHFAAGEAGRCEQPEGRSRRIRSVLLCCLWL
jgi:ABC-type uncharacterized transport system substrate-binding protein